MTPRRRLGVWVLAAAAALAAPLWLHAGIAHPALTGAACGLTGLSIILLLLATTPGDAIRLPRWASAVAIALGTVFIAVVAGLPMLNAAALGGCILLLVPLSGRRLFGIEPHSPWIVTLLLWHPALWLQPPLRSRGIEPGDEFWIAQLAALLCVGQLVRRGQAPDGSPISTVLLVLAWQVAGAAALVIAWSHGG